jgi:hypothetical protein
VLIFSFGEQHKKISNGTQNKDVCFLISYRIGNIRKRTYGNGPQPARENETAHTQPPLIGKCPQSEDKRPSLKLVVTRKKQSKALKHHSAGYYMLNSTTLLAKKIYCLNKYEKSTITRTELLLDYYAVQSHL